MVDTSTGNTLGTVNKDIQSTNNLADTFRVEAGHTLTVSVPVIGYENPVLNKYYSVDERELKMTPGRELDFVTISPGKFCMSCPLNVIID